MQFEQLCRSCVPTVMRTSCHEGLVQNQVRSGVGPNPNQCSGVPRQSVPLRLGLSVSTKTTDRTEIPLGWGQVITAPLSSDMYRSPTSIQNERADFTTGEPFTATESPKMFFSQKTQNRRPSGQTNGILIRESDSIGPFILNRSVFKNTQTPDSEHRNAF